MSGQKSCMMSYTLYRIFFAFFVKNKHIMEKMYIKRRVWEKINKIMHKNGVFSQNCFVVYNDSAE